MAGIFGYLWYLLIPGLIFAVYAQLKVMSTYNKYSKISSANNISGKRAARQILDAEGLSDVGVEEIPGRLKDNYDSDSRTLRLSNEVYQGNSLAALGVAAHEASHAIQHARKYFPLMLRTSIYPTVALSSYLWFYIFIIGLIFHHKALLGVGIILFAGIVLFQIVTLPVEYNASARAIALLSEQGIINDSEVGATKAVLNAAALTYLASTLMGILQLVRLLMLKRTSS